MKFLLFLVLLLNTVLTVISVTGFNDMVLLQPVSSPGLVLRKVPGTLPSGIRMPTGQSSPSIVLLRPVLFQLKCLKESSARGRLKNHPGSTRPEFSIPGREGPAYKTVNKNQGNNYDKIPDSYRPNTSFENEKRYFRGFIPMPLPYRININRYHRYKPYGSREGNKFIKNSFPHSNQRDNISEIEKVRRKGMIPPFYTTSRTGTSTTKRSPIKGTANKPISVELTDERVIHFNELVTNKLGIPIQDNDNLPTIVSYGGTKTFSKFSQPTTTSYSESTSSSILWLESKPRLNHSYEVEEIIEENIRFDLEEKNEENHTAKKPPGGRQFKFDENDHKGLTKVAPGMMKPAKHEVIDSSINTILNSLINPVKLIAETEKSEMPRQDNDTLPMIVSYGDTKTFSEFSQPSKRMKATTTPYSESTSSSTLWLKLKPRLNHSNEVEEIIEENTRFDLEEKKEEHHTTKKPPGGRQFKFDENDHEGFTKVAPDMMKLGKNEVVDSSIYTVLTSLINPGQIITEAEGKTIDKNNNTNITPPLTLQNSSSQPNKENFPNLPSLLPHSSVESSLPQEDKPQNGYVTNPKSDAPNPQNSHFKASTTETAKPKVKAEFPSHQSVALQNFQNWDPRSTSTRKYDKFPLQQLVSKESQENINLKNLAEMKHKTDDDFSKSFLNVKPNDLYLPEAFRNRVDEFSKPDRIFPTPKVVFLEETNMNSTTSSIQNQTTNPPKSSQEVLFSTALPEVDNSLDNQILNSLAERKEEKTVQQLFTSAPLLEFTTKNHNTETETEQSERDEETTTPSEFFETQTDFDLLNSTSKFETETHQNLLTPAKSSDDQHSINESVAIEDLSTSGFSTENTITSVSYPEGEESLSSSSSTWMAVSRNDIKLTTERNNFEEDKEVKATTFKEFTNVSEAVDLLNTTKKYSAQESNWKSNRKMHFNQKPAKIIFDNQIIDNAQKGQRRSDITINDTLEDYGENQRQTSSLNYIESLKEHSSHLNAGSLIKIAPQSIIPIIPKVINDLRDGRFSDENLKVLSHAFGKYWPYIQALSKNPNLDILQLIKMKDEKDLESVLRSYVLEEPNTTTILKRRDDENVLDYGQVYDYLEDYKEMYEDMLSQEQEKENRKKIRIKRDDEEDLKRVEATREYFDSIAEEQNEEGGDYVYEDIMYDVPDGESDSSIIEMMEIADLQVYVRNVTSRENQE